MSWIDQRPDDAMDGAFTALGPEPVRTVEPGFFREAMSRLGGAVHVITTAGPGGKLGSTATAHNRLWNSVNENLDATETGIDVTSATNFEVPGYYRVDNEILNCTSKSGSTLTCARGALGTTAATHDGRSTLSAAITGTSTENITESNGSSFIVPGYFNIDNEVVNCPTKSSNTLQNCTRGQRGTLAATHANSVNIRPSIDSIEIGEVQVWPYQRAAKNRVHYFFARQVIEHGWSLRHARIRGRWGIEQGRKDHWSLVVGHWSSG